MVRKALVLLVLLAGAARAFGEVEYREPNPSEERFFTVILTDEDRAAYESLPPEERAAWKRRYWASVDPTPTTDENQRETEHQRRVVETIRLFRDKEDRFVFDDRARSTIRFGTPKRRELLVGEVVIHEGLRTPREFW
ncbi:MAG: GWxTD domain-containing protein, partial [Candidatus Eisenbacteria bacterium]